MGLFDRGLTKYLTLTIVIEMNWFLLIELLTILTPSGSRHNDFGYGNNVDYETTAS